MPTDELTLRHLTEREQETFRRDFQDKEREIQRYIGVYLSGLVIVTGWVIGPQSRPILAMALGNDGYNVYAFLIFLVLNIVFTNFLIYKSLIIHEITQFMTYLAKPNSPFLFWDSWRRSRQSVTKPVRKIYSTSLAFLPLCASLLLMWGVWKLLYADPNALVRQFAEIEQNSAAGQTKEIVETAPANSSVNETQSPQHQSLTALQLRSVFWWARIWFWIVVALHLCPFTFLYHNWRPTDRRWKKLHDLRSSTQPFEELTLIPNGEPNKSAETNPSVNPNLNNRTTRDVRNTKPATVQLYDKATKRVVGEISIAQFAFLQSKLLADRPNDTDFYIDKKTIDMLKESSGDEDLVRKLHKMLGSQEGIEIVWLSDDSS